MHQPDTAALLVKPLGKRDKYIMIRLTDQESRQINAAAAEAGATSIAGYIRDHMLHAFHDKDGEHSLPGSLLAIRDELIKVNTHLEQPGADLAGQAYQDWIRDTFTAIRELLEQIHQDHQETLLRANDDHERLLALIGRQQREIAALATEIEQHRTLAKVRPLLDR